MYRHHFGLHDKPFRVVPSPRFLFASETHDEGRARMLYGIREGRGFVVVTGRIGLGKTTILLSVLEELDSNVRSALIFNPVDTYEQLLRMVADEFGLVTESEDAVGLLRDLNQFLVEALARGDSCVLLIDEAQNLSIEILERIRLLSNLQTEEASLLQIVLVGQPELHEKLQDARLLQLKQRVGVWYEIQPLDQEETEDYIMHRLRLAGARRPKEIIPVRTCRRVHGYAQGIPRVINQLCDTALVIAFGRNAAEVEGVHVDEAARELQVTTEAPPVPKRSVSTPGRHRPGRRPRRALALATGTILVFAILVVVFLGWIRGSWSPWFLTTGEAAGLEKAQADGVAEPLAIERGDVADDSRAHGEAVAATIGSPEPIHEPAQEEDQGSLRELPAEPGAEGVSTSALARMRDRCQLVESWRAAGSVVYTVHLASFRDAASALDFAEGLVDSQEDWSDPLYVEASGLGSAWYRVLGGGFRDRAEARKWSRRVKDEHGISYAQVARLAPQARFLFEPFERESTVPGAEG